MTLQIADRTKRKPLLIGILLLLAILAGIFFRPISVPPYRANQFILVTSDEYNWPEDHIFALLPDGSHASRLARGIESACSPDGRRIAFVGVDKPEEHFYASPSYIFVMDSDGTNIKQLTSRNDQGGSPVWSPDGEKIAFQKGSGISILDVNTLDVKEYPLPSSKWNAFDPTWSPDKPEIAFVADHVEDPTNNGLYIASLDGGNWKQLATGEKIVAPAWSPDGKNILFLYGTERNVLRTITPDGNIVSEIKLPPDITVYSHPKWSPDSQRILFSAQHQVGRAYEIAIFTIRKDGSDLKVLVHPAWFTLGQDVGENFPLPRAIHYGDVDWCEVH